MIFHWRVSLSRAPATHKSTTALCMHRKHVYMRGVYAFTHHIRNGVVQMSRAQPFLTYHGKIWCDHVIFIPTEMPKRVQEARRKTLIFNCWATVRTCTLGAAMWLTMGNGPSRADNRHGGHNKSVYTGRTRHFVLQVCCGVRVAHGEVRRAKPGFCGEVLAATTTVGRSAALWVWMCQVVYLIRCKTSLVGQSAGLSVPRSPLRF